MAGLVPAIHALLYGTAVKAWMPGIKTGMTRRANATRRNSLAAAHEVGFDGKPVMSAGKGLIHLQIFHHALHVITRLR